MAIRDAGKLNRLVTIEKPVDTPDGAGGYTRNWVKVGTAKVQATPIAGKEQILAEIPRATQPWRIEMRWRADLAGAEGTSYRMTADWLPGRHLAIQSVADPAGTRRWLVLFAEAVAF